MKNYFTISELCINQSKDVPLHVADKLLKYHILPMNKVRDELGAPIYASQRSGYRSIQWEIAKGRSGQSEHTFIGKGAIDWTAGDLLELFKLILKHTNYTRIAVYPDGSGSFIHCDYKANERQLFLSNSSSKWRVASEDDIIKVLED